ncbi:hypothetical protein GCM10010191_15520 [Actinomadura vinacea]|uniref:ATP-grasp domain-containing protein n=1 Tax=Actinomadura vinacea TaxID=115336 RepID=A0ABN3ILH2_9ACTN
MPVALATFSGLLEGSPDAQALRRALLALGVETTVAAWNDPSVAWDAFDLVVVRCTWDYTEYRDDFLAWAERVPRVCNAPDVLRWNTDKRYLRDLADAGVPVVPTLWDPDGLPSHWPEYVIKPAVSIGSRDTARWGPGEEDQARAHLRDLRARGRTVMLQPFLTAIETAGETALVFRDGEFSHAARKAPILRANAGIEGPVTGDDSRGQITPATATDDQLALARQTLAAVPGAPHLLYARVDMVPGPDGSPVVLELELTEPNLFLDKSPEAAQAFAQAISTRL